VAALTDTLALGNGLAIPQIGFGTWQIPDGQAVYEAVSVALQAGYRHIDTAASYGNEEGVGQAVRDSGIPRDEIFVTTKLRAEIKDAIGARAAFERSRDALGLGAIDLYLVHAPWPWSQEGADFSAENIEVWKVLEELYDRNETRAIGVSNFTVEDLESLTSATDVTPHANQLRWFVGNTRPSTTEWGREHGILTEGYSPLATGGLLNDPRLSDVAARYDVTVAQLALRWCRSRSRPTRSGSARTPASISTSPGTTSGTSTRSHRSSKHRRSRPILRQGRRRLASTGGI
jgi:diketogulonate reductase-like aldo/keto reductase